jgi:hypothetical protein
MTGMFITRFATGIFQIAQLSGSIFLKVASHHIISDYPLGEVAWDQRERDLHRNVNGICHLKTAQYLIRVNAV